MKRAILDDVRAQDRALRERGIVIWIGAEPTFTRRESHDGPWLWQAEGGDKVERAKALLTALAPRLPGPAVLRCVEGRAFPEEPKPRFCYGALFRRDGAAIDGHPFAATCEGRDTALDHAPIAPPDVDGSHAYLTVTPDPGVVEVNMAPAHDLETFAAWSDAVFEAAHEAGLSAVRYRYNGYASDSGGGGQITLGGPTAEGSPFFTYPALLPGLLRYVNRHPALSYWFSSDCIGSASQGPRPDEGVRERFEELAVALDLLDARGGDVGPEALWETLAPLLVDGSGNSHRAEINIEKLWNRHFERRGCLGVVEFRALRMQPTAERMVAVAALLRAVAARVALAPYELPLIDWAHALHDTYALPHFLRESLAAVLVDLAEHGLGLGPAITEALMERRPEIVDLELGDGHLVISPALEFWPLLGDVASQETRGARLVDASTERIEIFVHGGASIAGDPGVVSACGVRVPLTEVVMADGARAFVAGVRYRAFVPNPGLHPGLAPSEPVTITWTRGGESVAVAMHAWAPGGGAYDGVPNDSAEADARRRARVVRIKPSGDAPREPRVPMDGRLAVDLRRDR